MLYIYIAIIIVLVAAYLVMLWAARRKVRAAPEPQKQEESVLAESKQNYPSEDETVRLAEEDWMRQMFSGTIHNIGNVITVARLAVSELEEANNEKKEVLDMILGEILPAFESHVESGDIGQFLLEDPVGKQYVGSLRQLLQQQNKILQEQRETVAALTQKLNHITEIISLQQRLVSGVGRREIVPVNSLWRDAAKMMSESAARHEVEIALELQCPDAANIDPSMMTQVFINLLKNAIEALDDVSDRTREIKISTAGAEHKGAAYVKSVIRDNGPGMSREVLEQIFDFGFTTKTAESYGRGVGLNYCQRTIEKFGGFIEGVSEPGQGSEFNVWLKVAADND